MSTPALIGLDDLRSLEIAALLEKHLADMRAVSPPESKHALDIDDLLAANISFWTLRDGNELVGCIALKALEGNRGEIKSMRVDNRYQRKGHGRRLVRYVIDEARRRQYRELLLETGSMEYFLPARRLYASFGFETCGPFETYVEDPNSVFMRLPL